MINKHLSRFGRPKLGVLITLLTCFSDLSAPTHAGLRLVVDNSNRSPVATPTQAEGKSGGRPLLLLPRQDDVLFPILQLSSEDFLASSRLDRALLAAHQLQWAEENEREETLLRLAEQTQVDKSLIQVAAQFLNHSDSTNVSLPQDWAHISVEFIARSTPQRFLLRLQFLADRQKNVVTETRQPLASSIGGLVYKHIVTDPYLSQSAVVGSPIDFKKGQDTAIQIITTFAGVSEPQDRKLTLLRLFQHYWNLEMDASTYRSYVQQTISQLLTPELQTDRGLAEMLKNQIYAQAEQKPRSFLDMIDPWQAVFINHRLVSVADHEVVVKSYRRYINALINQPHFASHSYYQNRLNKFLGFLTRDEKIKFIEGFLPSILASHNFLTSDGIMEQQQNAQAAYKIYAYLLELGLTDRSLQEKQNFLLKVVPGYMSSRPHYLVPNTEFEGQLTEKLIELFSVTDSARAQLLDMLDRANLNSTIPHSQFLENLRPLFTDPKQKAKFGSVYAQVLKSDLRSKSLMPSLHPEEFEQSSKNLHNLSEVMDPPQYYDFLENILRELKHTSYKLPNPMHQELEDEFAQFNGKRPGSRQHLKLIDCKGLISK